MHTRRIVLALLPVMAFAAAGGCNRESADRAGRPRVALVLKTLNSPFFIEMQRGAEEAASRLGVELVVQAAEREVDVERQMEVDRTGTGFLRVEIDLPELAERVRLDEVPFVMDVEPVVDRLALEVGDEPRNVDDCHAQDTTVGGCDRFDPVTGSGHHAGGR